MPELWSVDQGVLAITDLSDVAQRDAEEQEAYDAVLSALKGHLSRGQSIAYYVNEDLGHPDLGHCVALTYGTPEAQFEPDQFSDGPPEQCPDGLLREITGGINWRYRLKAVTTALPDISEPDWTDPPTTRVWLAVDIAAEGPTAITVLESILNDADEVVTWHVVNPANDTDRAEFEEVAERLRTVFEEQGPMEELFEQDTGVPPESPAYQGKIGEHLIGRHGYHAPYVAVKIREGNQSDLVEQHNRLHADPTAENLHHSHESLRPEDL